MKSIAVYCGSSFGNNPNIITVTKKLGQLLAESNITLIYGGAKVGLMGAVADEVLAFGGNVVGIIPKFLAKREVAHTGISELIMVNDMHERKMKMIEMSDGFITLPGGLGSMEELFEVLTWRILGQHNKPLGILNIDSFYDHLLTMMNEMVIKGFVKPQSLELLHCSTSPESLLQLMQKEMGNKI